MRSQSGALDVLGAARPRIELVPEAEHSAGQDMVDLAAMFDLALDPWQQRCREWIRRILPRMTRALWVRIVLG